MSLESIAARIREDAAKEAAGLVEAADSERRSALDEARRRLEEEFARDLDRVARNASELEARLRFHAAREADRMVETEKRALLDRAITNAVERLAGLPDAEYGELVTSILSACTMEGDIDVAISEDDADRITPALLRKASGNGRNFRLIPERHGGRGGVIMSSGGVSFNATFSMLASLERERLVMELAPMLADSGSRG